jgi:hypothetical protein
MCLRNTKQTIKDLRELADLIECLDAHRGERVAEAKAISTKTEMLIKRTVGSLLGIIVLPPNGRAMNREIRKGEPYKDLIGIDWDAWVHSTIV